MPDWKDVKDVELLELAKNGEVEAFGELYVRYVAVVFRYIYSHSDNRQDAEDLTEEVFLRVWRTISNYREQGVPFAAYLYHIARNIMVDHHRRNRNVSQDILIGDGTFVSENPDPGKVALDNLEHAELRQILLQLREDYRDVLILRFLSGLSPEETAAAMDRSVGAVRVLQHRALGAMRVMLESKRGE